MDFIDFPGLARLSAVPLATAKTYMRFRFRQAPMHDIVYFIEGM
jgi:hypothetical protein